MSAEFKIVMGLDMSHVDAGLAALQGRISGINAGGINSINSALQQTIASNPAVAQVITSMGGIGSAASGSTGGVNGLAGALGRAGATSSQVQGVANALNGVRGAAQGAQASSGGLFGSLGQSAQAAMGRLSGMQGSLAGIATAGGALAATAAIGGLIAIGTAAVNASAKFEAYRASLTTMLGDSDKAAQAFDRLVQFAAKTPFSLDQSVEGFTKLKALGLQPTEAAMTSYGNTASAMGKDLNQMIEAVADASTGEFERLKEFGIKSKTEGDKVAFTFQGVTTKVGNNSKEIQSYLQNIGNTNFAGAMAKQMETFNGATSNLSDTVDQTLAKIGDGLNKPLAGVINMITSGLSAITPLLSGLGTMFGGLITGVGSIVDGVATAFNAISGGAGESLGVIGTLTVAVNLIGQGFIVVGSVVGAVFGAMGQTIGGIIGFISTGFNNLWNWLTGSTSKTTQGMSLSFLGVLRAAKFLAQSLPQMFSAALGAVGGMFGIIGSRLKAFFSGDFNAFTGMGGAIMAGFKGAAGVIDGVVAKAGSIARDTKGAAQAWERLKGNTGKTGGATLDQLAGAAPKPTPSAGKKDGKDGKSDAEKEAEKAAKLAADRIKKEKEFFVQLDENAKVAGMMPQAAELYNKELELRKILGDGELKDAVQLSQAQKDHIANALKLKEIGEYKKAIGTAQQAADIEAIHIADKIAATAGVSAEKAAENLAVEEKLWPLKAQALKDSINLSDQELQKQLAILDAKERQNYATEHANDLKAAAIKDGTDYAKGAVADYGSKEARLAAATAAKNETMAKLEAAKAAGTATAGEFEAGVKKAAHDFDVAIGKSGETFATKLGGILSQIGSTIGGKLGGAISGIGGIADSIGGFAKSQDDMANKFGSAFGDGAKGIGKAVGGAMAGLQIGESVANLGKMIFKLNKEGQTGAKIGGAIGGLTGNPLIALGASVIGGLIGSLFHKVQWSTANLTGADPAAVGGSGSKLTEAASGAAGSVQSGLKQIADKLGGTVGAFSLAIGTFEGKWRVNTDSTTKELHYNNFGHDTLHDFGDDEQAAIAFGIEDAISDGAIKNISQTFSNVLQKLGADSAVDFANAWGDVMSDYDALIDPIGHAVRETIKPFDDLKATMIEVGYAAEDMTKLEAARSATLDALKKEQMSTFTDLMDMLNGEAAGVTALSRLNADMAKLNVFRADLAAGKAIDKDELSTLVNRIQGENKDVYGTATGQGAAIVQTLKDVVLSASNAALDRFNSAATPAPVTTPANDNTQVVTGINTSNSLLALNNSYSEQILGTLQYIASSGFGSVGAGLIDRTNSRVNQV